MSSIIRIKRSSTAGNPGTLGAGELAYSALADNGSNGGDRLYVGMGTEVSANAANHVIIGGKRYTDLIDAATNLNTASTIVKRDASGNFSAGTITATLTGNADTATNGVTLAGAQTLTNKTLTSPAINLPTIGGTGAIFSGSTSGSTTVLATAVASTTTLTFPAATDTLIGKATTDTLTNKTFNTAGTGNVFQINGTGITAVTGTGAVVLATLPLFGATGINFSGSTSGSTTVLATAVAGSTTLTLPAATDTLIGKATTDTLTNKTFNTASTGNSFSINSTAITAVTGTGAVVLATSGVLVTPVLGVAAATSINKVTITTPVTGSTLTIADGKTLTVSNTLTFTGTDTSFANFAAGGTVAYTGTSLAQFAATTSSQLAGVISDETGSGAVVFANTPTLVTPILGIPASGTMTNVTGLPLTTGVTGTLPVANGGTGTTSGSITGTGALSFSAGGVNTSVNLVPNGTGTVDVTNARITSVATPTQTTDAATKGYVDAVKQALDIKDSVRVATTANLTATAAGTGVGKTLTNSGTQAALTIDSILLVSGDRVLVKDQTLGANNGIYTVTTVGTASTNWVLTRATDADNSPTGEVTPGMFAFVEEGTVNQDSGWVLTTDGVITIDTTILVFVQFSGAGQVVAGAGLTKTGNTLDVVGTTNRITANADSIDIASTYVGQSSLTTLGTIATGVWQGTIITPTYGGTGVNNGSFTLTLAGSVTHAGAFARTFTCTALTSVTLPTSGTLSTLAGTEALTGKTVNGLIITTTTGTLTVISGGTLATAGAFSTTLTSTAATNVTLPTTGTLTTLAGSEALSNKTISASSFAGSVAATTLSASGLTTITNTTAATALGTASVVLSGGLSVANTIIVGLNITGAGAATSTLDAFNIDGGTY